uniref:Uncharacterized protein n=1 Tax=Arundo donax TaxID=35708 RepID=A0A0A8Y914_ARUDO
MFHYILEHCLKLYDAWPLQSQLLKELFIPQLEI